MRLRGAQVKKFQQKIYRYYTAHGRSFPWRNTTNPYHILVSEVMLQQTQVDRVVSKYKLFIKKFPTVRALATASLAEVLRSWQGLGYNRRAKMLHQAATIVFKKYKNVFPQATSELDQLPGVGPYTAAAIAAFAFNQPNVCIETNIRTVFIHEFFPRRKKVEDSELLPLIEQTLDSRNPRQWYSALMDYGAHLKQEHSNPSRKSSHYTRQSKFSGSNRQLRGAILRELSIQPYLTKRQLQARLDFSSERVTKALLALAAEGLLRQRGQKYFL